MPEDRDNIEKSFELFHLADKRLTVVEIELKQLKEVTSKAISDVAIKQESHEQKFEVTFQAMTKALVGIESKLDIFISGSNGASSAYEKIVKYGIPIVIALGAGIWALYTH